MKTRPSFTPTKTYFGMSIKCPGCGFSHTMPTRNYTPEGATRHDVSQYASWEYDGNAESPTFSPSLLVRWDSWDGATGRPSKKNVCHSFIRAGRIEYLNDCTHPMKGQTVDLPDIPEDET
jgi:hypothetical protein